AATCRGVRPRDDERAGDRGVPRIAARAPHRAGPSYGGYRDGRCRIERASGEAARTRGRHAANQPVRYWRWAGAHRRKTMTVKRVVANIAVEDVAAADAFYAGILGMEKAMD